MIIAVILLILLVVGVVVAMVFALRMVKKMDNTTGGGTLDPSSIRTSQQFLPFKDIKDGMIDLGNFKYRKIIECNSINFHLKTDIEQEMIEASFARLLNSFKYPITFYVQTREIDLSDYLMSLKGSIIESVNEFPALENYGNKFYNEMLVLPRLLGNSKQKKKFIIVAYDGAALSNMNEAEMHEHALRELDNRVISILNNIAPLGIQGSVLNDEGLIELFYSTYHKDDYSNFENVLTGEHLENIVGHDFIRDENNNLITCVSKNQLIEMDDFTRLNDILNNAKQLINEEILERGDADEISMALSKQIFDRLNNLQDKINQVKNQ